MNALASRVLVNTSNVERREAAADAAPRPSVDAGRVLQIQAAVLAHQGFGEAATAFASELASGFGAARVYLGLFENGATSIHALSGEVDFLRNAELCRAVAAAMDESIQQAASIGYPAVAGGRPRITLAHAEVARRIGSSVATVPLVNAGRLIGAVTLEHPAGTPPDAQTLALCEQVCRQVAPVLELKRNADRPWHLRLALVVREAREYVAGPGHTLLKAGVVATAISVLLLCFVPVDYRVSAPAHLEGAIQRVLVAPSDGFLRDVHVKPGDAVVAEQVLVELADQELDLQRRKWESELAQHENGYLSALAQGERTQYAVNFAKADAARAQLALVEQEIARSRLRAPFDGIVIQGDLSQSLGAPVQRGDALLTVAPADEYRLIVQVDERDIGSVTSGSTGSLALAALPDGTYPFTVVRVTPVATAKEGRNFYEVEGRFASAPPELRPGLQGVAKIAAGERPLAWILAHRFVDWARLAFWSLGG